MSVKLQIILNLFMKRFYFLSLLLHIVLLCYNFHRPVDCKNRKLFTKSVNTSKFVMYLRGINRYMQITSLMLSSLIK